MSGNASHAGVSLLSLIHPRTSIRNAAPVHLPTVLPPIAYTRPPFAAHANPYHSGSGSGDINAYASSAVSYRHNAPVSVVAGAAFARGISSSVAAGTGCGAASRSPPPPSAAAAAFAAAFSAFLRFFSARFLLTSFTAPKPPLPPPPPPPPPSLSAPHVSTYTTSSSSTHAHAHAPVGRSRAYLHSSAAGSYASAEDTRPSDNPAAAWSLRGVLRGARDRHVYDDDDEDVSRRSRKSTAPTHASPFAHPPVAHTPQSPTLHPATACLGTRTLPAGVQRGRSGASGGWSVVDATARSASAQPRRTGERVNGETKPTNAHRLDPAASDGVDDPPARRERVRPPRVLHVRPPLPSAARDGITLRDADRPPAVAPPRDVHVPVVVVDGIAIARRDSSPTSNARGAVVRVANRRRARGEPFADDGSVPRASRVVARARDVPRLSAPVASLVVVRARVAANALQASLLRVVMKAARLARYAVGGARHEPRGVLQRVPVEDARRGGRRGLGLVRPLERAPRADVLRLPDADIVPETHREGAFVERVIRVRRGCHDRDGFVVQRFAFHVIRVRRGGRDRDGFVVQRFAFHDHDPRIRGLRDGRQQPHERLRGSHASDVDEDARRAGEMPREERGVLERV
eukprot:31312-Pelagococcus_subviridis.AAC.11